MNTAAPIVRWYFRRGDANVPLIAADELPSGLHPDDFPRALADAEAAKLQFVGKLTACPEAQQYSTASVPSRISHAFKASSRKRLQQSISNGKSIGYNQPTRSAQPSIDGPALRRLPPSGQEPDLSRKQFCSHWIRTGECDFMQQGCIYKHVMPGLATLKTIGFQKTPSWYQQAGARTRPNCPREEAAKPSSQHSFKSNREPISESAAHFESRSSSTESNAGRRCVVKKAEDSITDVLTGASQDRDNVPMEPFAQRLTVSRRQSLCSESEQEMWILNQKAPPLVPDARPAVQNHHMDSLDTLSLTKDELELYPSNVLHSNFCRLQSTQRTTSPESAMEPNIR